MGTFAVQLATSFGATVTAVCSTGKIDTVRALGADYVIDYTRDDFTQSGQQYDVIIAANGYHPLPAYKRALTATGRYIMVGGSTAHMFQAVLLGPLLSLTERKNMGGFVAKPNQKNWGVVAELLKAGTIAPVIDRCYPLCELPDAMR